MTLPRARRRPRRRAVKSAPSNTGSDPERDSNPCFSHDHAFVRSAGQVPGPEHFDPQVDLFTPSSRRVLRPCPASRGCPSPACIGTKDVSKQRGNPGHSGHRGWECSNIRPAFHPGPPPARPVWRPCDQCGNVVPGGEQHPKGEHPKGEQPKGEQRCRNA